MFCYCANDVGDFFWIFYLMVNSSIRELIGNSFDITEITLNYHKLVDWDPVLDI